MKNMNVKSKCVSDSLRFMAAGRGNIPVRVYWAIEAAPLEYRTFGGRLRVHDFDLTDETIENVFGGSYLLTLITGTAASRYLHAEGSIHSLYTDGKIFRFFERHGLTECGLWDHVNHELLDRELYDGSFNYSWAYSACKPYATLSEIKITDGMPLLFHDSDLILRRAYDKILGIKNPCEAAMAAGHLESIGTEFYPPFEDIALTSCFELYDSKLTDKNTGLSYRTDLNAVNTCLMYFSDFDAAAEWAVLFRDLMKDNHAEVKDFLTGEQLLLCADQRPGLMVADRRGLELMKDMKLFIPAIWTGRTFESVNDSAFHEWHYYRPEYRSPDEYPEVRGWNQDIMHTWNQKRDIENDPDYDAYFGVFHIELLMRISDMAGLNPERLEHCLRSFNSLSRYFELYDSGHNIEELIDAGKISDILRKGLFTSR